MNNQSKQFDTYDLIQDYQYMGQTGFDYEVLPIKFSIEKLEGLSVYCSDNHTLITYKGKLFRLMDGLTDFVYKHRKTNNARITLPIPKEWIHLMHSENGTTFVHNEVTLTLQELINDQKSDMYQGQGTPNAFKTNISDRSDDVIYSRLNHDIFEQDHKKDLSDKTTQMESLIGEKAILHEQKTIEAVKNMENHEVDTNPTDFYKLVKISITSLLYSAAARLVVDYVDRYRLSETDVKTIISAGLGATFAHLLVEKKFYLEDKGYVRFSIAFGVMAYVAFQKYAGENWTYDYVLKYFITNMNNYQKVFNAAKKCFEEGNVKTTNDLITMINSIYIDQPNQTATITELGTNNTVQLGGADSYQSIEELDSAQHFNNSTSVALKSAEPKTNEDNKIDLKQPDVEDKSSSSEIKTKMGLEVDILSKNLSNLDLPVIKDEVKVAETLVTPGHIANKELAFTPEPKVPVQEVQGEESNITVNATSIFQPKATNLEDVPQNTIVDNQGLEDATQDQSLSQAQDQNQDKYLNQTKVQSQNQGMDQQDQNQGLDQQEMSDLERMNEYFRQFAQREAEKLQTDFENI